MLTIPQVAQRLSVSRQRVGQWVRQGRIRATLVGGVWIVAERDCKRPKARAPGRKVG